MWTFPYVFDGGGIGFNDGGTQLFKDDSISSLAKEVCQNSLDASDIIDKPVIIEFKPFYIKKEDFPGYEQFKEIIKKELNYVKELYKNNKNAINYYEKALKTLENDILVLRISDFNTTGLTEGENKMNNNWSNLVVHSGTNDKSSEAGGSFGLGKNAMYACSRFGTLLFETNTGSYKSEAVSKLSSFVLDNKTIHGLGFYGNYNDKNHKEIDKPFNKLLNLDKNYQERTNHKGTDIYILGFDMKNNMLQKGLVDKYNGFEKEIVSSIIDSYFTSIIEEKLVVKVNDIMINRDNIKKIFESMYLEDPNLFNVNTLDYLNIMLSKDKIIKKISICEDNDAIFYLKLDSNFHNKVAIVRNTGMKIFDKDRFPSLETFSGVFILKGKLVNGLFKKMENPTHNGWMIDRIKNNKEVYELYKEMTNKMHKIIKNIYEKDKPDEIDMPGLSEFLPDEFEDNSGKRKENINNIFKDEIKIVKENLTKDAFSKGHDQGNLNKSSKEKTNSKKSSSNSSHNKSDHKIIINEGNKISIINKRIIYANDEYILFLNIPKDIDNLILQIKISGENNDFNPIIKEASYNYHNLNIYENKIEVGSVHQNERLKISFKLEDMDLWSLEVRCYEN